jgi:hypothetical protein
MSTDDFDEIDEIVTGQNYFQTIAFDNDGKIVPPETIFPIIQL